MQYGPACPPATHGPVHPQDASNPDGAGPVTMLVGEERGAGAYPELAERLHADDGTVVTYGRRARTKM